MNRAGYPDASLADFSFLVPAPAGRTGFVTAKPDGHFYFADGTRAKFWGVNITAQDLAQPDTIIDETVARFRRAGINMLRLETGGGGTNGAGFRKLHRWMHAARDNGLYLYLRLPDDTAALSEASGSDAVERRKASARVLLTTPNPFNGRKPVEDPAVAVLELASEPQPAASGSATQEGQRAEAITASAAGSMDETRRGYYREMRAFLRSLGVRVPMTAAAPPEASRVQTVANELDATTGAWFGDSALAGLETPGQAAMVIANNDPLTDTGAWNAASALNAARWKGKPLIIREWAGPWPNAYRATTVPLAAAYAAYLDIDGMVAHRYQFTGGGRLGPFHAERDPVFWGQMGLGALLFLRGDLQPSREFVELTHDAKAVSRSGDGPNSLNRLAFAVRLENVPKGEAGKSGAALTLAAQPEDPQEAMKAALLRLQSEGRLVDDTLETVAVMQGLEVLGLNTRRAAFSVVSPRSVLLAGRLAAFNGLYPGFHTGTPYGSLWAASLDGQPLDRSDCYIIKMVSVARNTGEALVAKPGPPPDRFTLQVAGAAPIVTNGKPSDNPTRWLMAGSEAPAERTLEVGMTDGTWEMEVDGTVARVFSDTAGVRFRVPGAARAQGHREDGSTEPLAVENGVFTYPPNILRVELTFE